MNYGQPAEPPPSTSGFRGYTARNGETTRSASVIAHFRHRGGAESSDGSPSENACRCTLSGSEKDVGPPLGGRWCASLASRRPASGLLSGQRRLRWQPDQPTERSRKRLCGQ